MKKSYEIHVISNTHWDREWLNDFRETRMMLVEFFDRLLDILDNEPRFNSYVLDAQTIPIEDYLEVRPEKREGIVRHVTSGRLLVGPWYTCPEGFCVNGESLVRNLLYGHRVARSFGGVMKVGHTPFSYGQNSQMPQIYAGFGIDTILFYHGVSHDDTPNEFLFEGADGTRILGSQMSSGARYNFYHNVYRRVLYGTRIDDREYTWTQGGLPFHLCSEDHWRDHHILLDPVTHFHKEYIEECVQDLRQAEIDTATTKYLAFMDGHDSSLADTATLRIIDEAQKHLGNDKIFHSSLTDLMDKIKKAAKNLPVLKGERRVPAPMGARLHLYSDVLSCRTRMKRTNAHAEFALQRRAEPYAVIAWLLGREYPASSLDTAWKLLLRSHAHDSIAGTGVDDIERDMYHRLRQVTNISKSLTLRSLQHIQHRIDNAAADKNDVLLTVFNPSPYPRSEVITALVDLPSTSKYDDFSLREDGKKTLIPLQLVSRTPHHAVINHAGDATAMMKCDRATFYFEARKVPAMGYTTYSLAHKPSSVIPAKAGIQCGHNTMENKHLRVDINPDGTLRIKHKATDAEFDGLHYFEDGGEAGHAWMHIEPAFDSIVTSQERSAQISLEEDGPLLTRYKIVYTMTIPTGLDENGGDPWKRLDGAENASRRTDETHEMTITSIITLRKGARSLDVVTRFNNPCKSHRLRVMFPTRLMPKTCAVENTFDVVQREVVYSPDSPWAQAIKPTFPMQRFVDVSGRKVGLAIVNDGLREYEVTPDADRAIALTLMRAFEVALTTVSKRWEHHPEMTLSQCLGDHEFRYAIYPHEGQWDKAEVFREAERLSVPLEPAQAGAHGGDLPRRHSFLNVEPANLILSALKRAEDGKGLIIRLFNPTTKSLEGKLRFFKPIASAHLCDLEENPIRSLTLRGRSLQCNVASKKILTIKTQLSTSSTPSTKTRR